VSRLDLVIVTDVTERGGYVGYEFDMSYEPERRAAALIEAGYPPTVGEPPETYAQWDLGPPFHGTEDERAEYLARVASAEGVPLETILRRWRWVQALAKVGIL
jgi:hypothetical protein